jgi:hypothetical protein|tara:strand:+ start:68 stop:307 length:240 start_codon:yes stop_codon:yes gene_type:complete
MKIDFQHVISVVSLALLSWAAMQVSELKSEVAVVSYKVEENYEMIKPMWQDFLVRKANHYADIKGTNSVPSFQASRRED